MTVASLVNGGPVGRLFGLKEPLLSPQRAARECAGCVNTPSPCSPQNPVE